MPAFVFAGSAAELVGYSILIATQSAKKQAQHTALLAEIRESYATPSRHSRHSRFLFFRQRFAQVNGKLLKLPKCLLFGWFVILLNFADAVAHLKIPPQNSSLYKVTTTTSKILPKSPKINSVEPGALTKPIQAPFLQKSRHVPSAVTKWFCCWQRPIDVLIDALKLDF